MVGNNPASCARHTATSVVFHRKFYTEMRTAVVYWNTNFPLYSVHQNRLQCVLKTNSPVSLIAAGDVLYQMFLGTVGEVTGSLCPNNQQMDKLIYLLCFPWKA